MTRRQAPNRAGGVEPGGDAPTAVEVGSVRLWPSLNRPGAALAVAATSLAFAALAIMAYRSGPLVAHPRAVRPPPPPPGGEVIKPPDTLLMPPNQVPVSAGGDWLRWIGLALAILVVATFAWWLVVALRRARRPRPVAASGTAPQFRAGLLASLAEPAAADLGDPRTFLAARAADDIIASWELVEEAAASCGWRRGPATTPTEFLELTVAALGEAEVSLTEVPDAEGAAVVELLPQGRAVASSMLLTLYHRARFDTLALGPGAATIARSAARGLVLRWDPTRRMAEREQV